MVRAMLVIFLTVALSSLTVAQDIWPGTSVKPKYILPLRSEPPSGIFGAKGPEIDKVSPKVEYRVLQRKTYSTISGGETWLQVMSPGSKTGWIYSGTKANPTANVTLSK